MSDDCGNCGSKIAPNTTFKAGNGRVDADTVAFVNFINDTKYSDLCGKCGDAPKSQAYNAIDGAIKERVAFIEQRIADFPMFTTSWLPAGADVKLKNMITANVTVGTGIFSELSQGVSDAIGSVNVSSGMSYKINKGEAAVRSILVRKAMSLSANCILGVDIDYGTTGNNAATVNMQGTAAVISDLSVVLDAEDLARATELQGAFARIDELRRWRSGDIHA
jgi:uncharacterized protein YbjQ (UPF0145 family)